MKTLKKILAALFCLYCFGVLLSSCVDKEYEPIPKIKCIIPADRTKQDSLLVSSNSGTHIIIVGENLQIVDQVLFDDVPAVLNPLYVTEHYIILIIPDVPGSTSEIILVTKYGQRIASPFAIDIPAPRIDMFLCEFVPVGEILKIKGKYFIDPLAYFYGEDGQLIPAEIVPQEPKSSDYIDIKVPAGVKHSTPVVIENGTGKSESKILFRDKRNIIIDFDQYKATWGYSGTIDQGVQPDADGRCTWKESYLSRLPKGDNSLNPKGCDGVYAQLNTNVFNGWYDIIFYVPEEDYDNPKKSCVERFADEYPLEALTLKFEVYVHKEYPINGMYGLFAFAPEGSEPGSECFGRDLSGNNKADNIRVPGAWWVPFTPEIDKTDAWWKWEIGKGAKEVFYTDEWITVSVPLSTFNKQTAGTHPLGVANYIEAGTGNDPFCQTPLYKDRMWNFAFFWEPWSQCKQEGDFLCFLDNFRIVPDDKNGALFGVAGGMTRKF